MHRVELKGQISPYCHLLFRVPNAPCGVESQTLKGKHIRVVVFLMHRVELKVLQILVSEGLLNCS